METCMLQSGQGSLSNFLDSTATGFAGSSPRQDGKAYYVVMERAGGGCIR